MAAELTPQQHKRIEGIMEILKEFLDARFEHAVRINPSISHVYTDLSWQQMSTMREIISQSKAFGPIRYYVCDILSAEDDGKKTALFKATDQNTILNEIVNLAEEGNETTSGNLAIRDMRTFYKTLDPSLERIVELVQTWIWWDLPDAAEIFTFSQEYERILKLAKQPLSEKILDYYRKAMKKTGEVELTKRDILGFEIHKLENIIARLRERLRRCSGFQVILKRDPQPSKVENEIIMNLARHISNLNRVAALETLPPELQSAYAASLRVPAPEVKKETVMQFENSCIAQMREKLKEIMEMGRSLGAPYDYKLVRIDNLALRLDKLKAAILPGGEKPAEEAAEAPAEAQ